MTAVSYVITVYNKEEYLPEVIRSLEAQVGIDERQYVFVDDGSSDRSVEIIKECTKGTSAEITIIEQENLGASAGTNAGVAASKHEWIKLCDGDDLLTPHSSIWLIEACEKFELPHAWGNSSYFEWQGNEDPLDRSEPEPRMEAMEDGLTFFIRNNPANSTCMLFKKSYFEQIKGCDERLVSPDHMLFFRLFANSKGARVHGDVGLLPHAAPQRLSAQKGRSRYESVLAIYFLLQEKPELKNTHLDFAYRRAISRAERFHRNVHNKGLLNRFILDHLRSHYLPHLDKMKAIKKILGAFTPDGSIVRPLEWRTGAYRKGRVGEDF